IGVEWPQRIVEGLNLVGYQGQREQWLHFQQPVVIVYIPIAAFRSGRTSLHIGADQLDRGKRSIARTLHRITGGTRGRKISYITMAKPFRGKVVHYFLEFVKLLVRPGIIIIGLCKCRTGNKKYRK